MGIVIGELRGSLKISQPNLSSAYAVSLAHRLASKVDGTGMASAAKASALQTNAVNQSGNSFARALEHVDEAVVSYNEGIVTQPKSPESLSENPKPLATPLKPPEPNLYKAPVTFNFGEAKAMAEPPALITPTASPVTPAPPATTASPTSTASATPAPPPAPISTNAPAQATITQATTSPPQSLPAQEAASKENIQTIEPLPVTLNPPTLVSTSPPPQSVNIANIAQAIPQPNFVSALYQQVTQAQQSALTIAMPKELPKAVEDIRKKNRDDKDKKTARKTNPLNLIL
jgi:hypothetical protein